MKHEKLNNRSFLKNRWKAFVRNIKNRPFEEWTVETTQSQIKISVDSYFGICGTKETWAITWNEIISATAFKSDNFTTDTIWISFETKNGENISVPEDAEGWQDAVDKLPSYLSGTKPVETWFNQVALPPFEENRQLIYERKTT
jgi:hypothetical protein